MDAVYRLSFYHRIERQWAECIKWLRQMQGQFVDAVERTLQRIFNNDGLLIPVPIRTIVNRRRLERPQPRD